MPFASLCQNFLEKSTGPNFRFPSRICLGQTRMPNESLVKNSTNDGSEFLLSYASSFENDYLSVQLHGLSVVQVLAKEFYFHRTCCRDLSRKWKEEVDETSQKCLGNLKDFIQKHIMDQAGVMKVSKLTAIYEGYQSSIGVPVKGTSNRLTKTRLMRCFKEKLIFTSKARLQVSFFQQCATTWKW